MELYVYFNRQKISHIYWHTREGHSDAFSYQCTQHNINKTIGIVPEVVGAKFVVANELLITKLFCAAKEDVKNIERS